MRCRDGIRNDSACLPGGRLGNVFYIGATAEGAPILKWWRFTRGSGVPWENIGIGDRLTPRPARGPGIGCDWDISGRSYDACRLH